MGSTTKTNIKNIMEYIPGLQASNIFVKSIAILFYLGCILNYVNQTFILKSSTKLALQPIIMILGVIVIFTFIKLLKTKQQGDKIDKGFIYVIIFSFIILSVIYIFTDFIVFRYDRLKNNNISKYEEYLTRSKVNEFEIEFKNAPTNKEKAIVVDNIKDYGEKMKSENNIIQRIEKPNDKNIKDRELDNALVDAIGKLMNLNDNEKKSLRYGVARVLEKDTELSDLNTVNALKLCLENQVKYDEIDTDYLEKEDVVVALVDNYINEGVYNNLKDIFVTKDYIHESSYKAVDRELARKVVSATATPKEIEEVKNTIAKAQKEYNENKEKERNRYKVDRNDTSVDVTIEWQIKTYKFNDVQSAIKFSQAVNYGDVKLKDMNFRDVDKIAIDLQKSEDREVEKAQYEVLVDDGIKYKANIYIKKGRSLSITTNGQGLTSVSLKVSSSNGGNLYLMNELGKGTSTYTSDIAMYDGYYTLEVVGGKNLEWWIN